MVILLRPSGQLIPIFVPRGRPPNSLPLTLKPSNLQNVFGLSAAGVLSPGWGISQRVVEWERNLAILGGV
jgi:hypothetical protein